MAVEVGLPARRARHHQGRSTDVDETIRTALERGLTCDITTTGRRSGQPRRTEIWYFLVDGRVYITGTPGSRDWYANLLADPRLTFHVKQGALADLPARATPITEHIERARIMTAIRERNSWYVTEGHSLDEWVAGSPLVAVDFDQASVP
jgi:deazaflavin-dependent oxidoreductase (nitroreductase family)